MSESALMEVRTALATSSNNDWSGGTTLGGAEVQKNVQAMMIEAFNKSTDLAKMLPRKNINQLSYIWTLVKESAAGSGLSNSTFKFYSEGGSATPSNSSKAQLYAIAKAYRTDYEVTGLMVAAGMGDQLMQEAMYAAESHAIGEERAIISGAGTSAYGFSGAFDGLLQLMSCYDTFEATTSKYGTAMSSSNTFMDVQHVNAGGTASTTTTDALALEDLDSAITKSNKRGGKGHRRVFLCSEERGDEIEALLQAQQRFVTTGNAIEFDGGIRIPAYKYVPIIRSRFMDKNGILYDGTNATWSNHYTDDDGAMYLLDLNHIFMVHVAGVNAAHTPIKGSQDEGIRADVVGGYYKTYGTLVVDRFDTHVLIHNLTDI
jgi:hypothetical protein